jgi:hypothetical protein
VPTTPILNSYLGAKQKRETKRSERKYFRAVFGAGYEALAVEDDACNRRVTLSRRL